MKLLPLLIAIMLFTSCIRHAGRNEDFTRQGNECLKHHANMKLKLVGAKREGYMTGIKSSWVSKHAPNAKYPDIYGCVGKLPVGKRWKYVCEQCNKAVVNQFGSLAYNRY